MYSNFLLQMNSLHPECVSIYKNKLANSFGFVAQGYEDDERKVRRREKNRVAAQRSRKKQTQKADKLHEVNITLTFGLHLLIVGDC